NSSATEPIAWRSLEKSTPCICRCDLCAAMRKPSNTKRCAARSPLSLNREPTRRDGSVPTREKQSRCRQSKGGFGLCRRLRAGWTGRFCCRGNAKLQAARGKRLPFLSAPPARARVKFALVFQAASELFQNT